MYPRTEWVHAVRRWLDGEIGPDGVQLTLPGMPETPRITAQRTWFLVVADYANPDGFVVASSESLQRRWLIAPQTARTYWRLMRDAGWIRNLGEAHRGHVQRRELTVPKWARKPASEDPLEAPERRSPETPLSGERRSPGSERRSPQTPREVVRSKSVSQVMRASAPPARPNPMTDMTENQDHKQPPAPPPPKNTAPEPIAGPRDKAGEERTSPDPRAGEVASWLESLSSMLGTDLNPTRQATAQVGHLVAQGVTPRQARDQLQAAGHNLGLLHGGGILKALAALTSHERPPSIRPVEAWRANLPEQCPHQDRGLRPNQCWTCRAEAGERRTA